MWLTFSCAKGSFCHGFVQLQSGAIVCVSDCNPQIDFSNLSFSKCKRYFQCSMAWRFEISWGMPLAQPKSANRFGKTIGCEQNVLNFLFYSRNIRKGRIRFSGLQAPCASDESRGPIVYLSGLKTDKSKTRKTCWACLKPGCGGSGPHDVNSRKSESFSPVIRVSRVVISARWLP